MIEKVLGIFDNRQFIALTGLPLWAFLKLLPFFEESYQEIRQADYTANQAKRQRRPGAGQKGKLAHPAKKLFFILYYMKNYPTFDVLGDRFEMKRSKACANVHKLLPILLLALDKAGVLPKRRFANVEELQAAFAGITELWIDATERPHRRLHDAEKQRQMYSGKKKRHTVKNTVISTTGKLILFLGYTVLGSQHDYSLFKTEFPPDQDWFKLFQLWVDLGYLGIETDYAGVQVSIPHKKPRKSKAHPNPSLTDEQKAANRQMSQVRVLVEHAIGGMKRFNILTHLFRNRKTNLVDDVALLAAGLFNFTLVFKAAV